MDKIIFSKQTKEKIEKIVIESVSIENPKGLKPRSEKEAHLTACDITLFIMDKIVLTIIIGLGSAYLYDWLKDKNPKSITRKEAQELITRLIDNEVPISSLSKESKAFLYQIINEQGIDVDVDIIESKLLKMGDIKYIGKSKFQI